MYQQRWPFISRGGLLPAEVAFYQQRWPFTSRGGLLPAEVGFYQQKWPFTSRGGILPAEVAFYQQKCCCVPSLGWLWWGWSDTKSIWRGVHGIPSQLMSEQHLASSSNASFLLCALPVGADQWYVQEKAVMCEGFHNGYDSLVPNSSMHKNKAHARNGVVCYDSYYG